MRGQCRVGLVSAHRKICLASRKSNAVKNGEGKRSAEPPLPAPLSAGRRQGAGSSMSTACLSDFRIGSPVLLVDSTACGCCVHAVAAAPILARSDRQCTRVTATLEYGAQASMIELGSSIIDVCGARSAALLSVQYH